MKKILFLLALIIAIPLSACINSGVDTTMTIRPSEFSEETQEVLKIFEDEMVFLDYTVV